MRKRRKAKRFQGRYMVFEDKFGNRFTVKKYSKFGKHLLQFLQRKRTAVRFYGINIGAYLEFVKPKLKFSTNDHPNVKSFRDYILSDGLKALLKEQQ